MAMVKVKLTSYTEHMRNAHLILLKNTDDLAEFLKDFSDWFNGQYRHHPSLDKIPIGKPFIFEKDDSGDYMSSNIYDPYTYHSGLVGDILNTCKEIEQLETFLESIKGDVRK